MVVFLALELQIKKSKNFFDIAWDQAVLVAIYHLGKALLKR
jgi:hypothetical protein